MASLSTISLSDLYARKITSTVEVEIQKKEDFSKQSPNWCNLVCKLKCKNPPLGENIFPKREVDILIIQDFKAFDDPKFNKSGARIEAKHLAVIDHFAKLALRDTEGRLLEVGVTNLLKCQIREDDIKKGKAPTDTILQKCKPYLLEEIRQRKPKVIISLSTSVTKGLGMKKKSNYNERGEIVMSDLGVPVVITAHPRILMMLRQNSSGKMWGPDFYSVVLRDFKKAAALVNGTLVIPSLEEALATARKQIHIARSIEQVIMFKNIIVEKGQAGAIFSFDTETSSLDPYLPTAKLITAQFGYRNEEGVIEVFVFPLWHRHNVWYEADDAWPHLREVLLDPYIRKIGHNLKFDIIYTYVTTGVRPIGILFDTMLMLHAINSGLQGMYGLKKAVHDWIPELGLGGYEDCLPKITRSKEIEEINDEDEEGED